MRMRLVMKKTSILVFACVTFLAVGTALFVDPQCLVQIQDGIAQYLRQHGHKSLVEIVGALRW